MQICKYIRMENRKQTFIENEVLNIFGQEIT